MVFCYGEAKYYSMLIHAVSVICRNLRGRGFFVFCFFGSISSLLVGEVWQQASPQQWQLLGTKTCPARTAQKPGCQMKNGKVRNGRAAGTNSPLQPSGTITFHRLLYSGKEVSELTTAVAQLSSEFLYSVHQVVVC